MGYKPIFLILALFCSMLFGGPLDSRIHKVEFASHAGPNFQSDFYFQFFGLQNSPQAFNYLGNTQFNAHSFMLPVNPTRWHLLGTQNGIQNLTYVTLDPQHRSHITFVTPSNQNPYFDYTHTLGMMEFKSIRPYSDRELGVLLNTDAISLLEITQSPTGSTVNYKTHLVTGGWRIHVKNLPMQFHTDKLISIDFISSTQVFILSETGYFILQFDPYNSTKFFPDVVDYGFFGKVLFRPTEDEQAIANTQGAWIVMEERLPHHDKMLAYIDFTQPKNQHYLAPHAVVEFTSPANNPFYSNVLLIDMDPNGILTYSIKGSLYTLDPKTKKTTTLYSMPANSISPPLPGSKPLTSYAVFPDSKKWMLTPTPSLNADSKTVKTEDDPRVQIFLNLFKKYFPGFDVTRSSVTAKEVYDLFQAAKELNGPCDKMPAGKIFHKALRVVSKGGFGSAYNTLEIESNQEKTMIPLSELATAMQDYIPCNLVLASS